MELPNNKYYRLLINKRFNDVHNQLKPYFIERFREYRHLYNFKSAMVAYETIGSTYLAFMLSFALSKYKYPNADIAKLLEDNFYFSMMYSLVDTLLDTDYRKKSENIESIKHILYKGFKKDDSTPLIDALYSIYLHFSSREEVIEAMKISFEEEYKSYLVQYTKHKENVYEDVCEGIGYTMYNLMLKINNIECIEEYDRIIGYAGQLLDDIVDIQEDINEGINTIATCVYEKEGNIDRLYYDVMKRVGRLPDDEQYSIVKLTLLYGLYYAFSRCKYISMEIKDSVKKYVLIPDKYIKGEFIINTYLGKEIYDLL